ncbi:MAG: hypothetical protein HWE20_14570 [Gammaproteobacteria bacterium]|nr:hypothetical protein [Gammaproteobacteria bacterium]
MKNWVGTTAFSLAVVATSAHAFNLGQIELRSNLGQPLDARIQILNTLPGETLGIQARLADKAVFRRAGVERASVLDAISMQVVQNADGSAAIELRSNQPINDPYLNFFVDVDWGRGNLVREFTLLLDPPTGTQQPIAMATDESVQLQSSEVLLPGQIERSGDGNAVSSYFDSQIAGADQLQPIAIDNTQGSFFDAGVDNSALVQGGLSPQDTFFSNEPIAVASQRPKAAQPAAKPRPAPIASGGQKLSPVKRNDTLWEIAARVRPGGVSQQRMMVALLEANKSAFIGGNMNMIKAGAILRMPTQDELSALSQRAALDIIRDQTAAWKQMRNPSATAKVSSNAKPTAPAATDSGSSASDGAEQTAGSTDGQPSPEPSTPSQSTNALPVKELDIVGVEDNTDQNLSDEVATNDDQQAVATAIDNNASLIEEELITERGRNEDLTVRVAELENLVEDLKSLVQIRADEIARLQNQLAQADGGLAQAPTDITPAVDSQTAISPEPILAPDNTPVIDSTEPETVVPISPSIDNMADPFAPEPEPWWSGLIASAKPIGAGLLILALGGYLIHRRRKDKSEPANDEELDDQAALAGLAAAGARAKPAAAEKADEKLEDIAQWADDALADSDDQGDEVPLSDSARALKEATVYLEFKLWDRAIEWLKPVADTEPNNADIQLKLLEAHLGRQDHYEFETLLAKIRHHHGDNPSVVAQLERMQDELQEQTDIGGDLTLTMADDDLDTDPLADQQLEDTQDYGVDVNLNTFDDDSSDFDESMLNASIDSEKSDNGGLDFDLSELEATLAEFESDSIDSLDSVDNTDGGLDFEPTLDTSSAGDSVDMEGFGSIGDLDESETMLDLARAYIEMGDRESARSALNELISNGGVAAQEKATELLRSIE